MPPNSALEEGLLESSRGDGDAPLLDTLDVQEFIEDGPGPGALKSSSLDSISNLTNCILGAGMFALPRVFGALGLLGGLMLVVLVAWMTYATIAVMLRASETVNKWTYASTMHAIWGRRAAAGVHGSIIFGCVGFVALYMIVTCDVLVGNASYTGIISDLFPRLPDPLPWYLSRSALLTWIALAAAPLLSAHTLHGMAATSAVSVASSTMAMLFILALCAGAWLRGTLAPIRLWPDPSFFGDRPAVIMTHMIATLPVVMTAFICHMSIHPVARDLRQYTPYRMRRVVAISLGICALVYGATGAAGFQTFGNKVQGDVLSNLQPEIAADIMGCSDHIGLAFVATMKIFVAIAMLTSIPITLWPMREDVMGLLTTWMKGQEPSKLAFYTVTYLSLAAIWALSIAVESAYAMVGLVGATCGIAMAFLFPGMLALKLQGVKGAKLGGQGLLVLGMVLMVAGIASTVLGEG